ncbi:uncharacterized protein [Nicotiana sylvestris]|uniref:uncharacterized protein n=1 Tax=Nicotiana sylvestris TaxID=4096 RepID=UPI00388CE7BC
MESAYDILENLKEMFGDQNCAAKQTAMKALLNAKMVKGSSVRDHVLKTMSLLNELEVLGANIDKDTQVEMIPKTLPDSRSFFKDEGRAEEEKGSKSSVGGTTAGVEKAKGKCYHCKQPGHHKKQCPTYLAKLKNKPGDLHLLVVETLLAAVSTISWCVDSGATNHVCTYFSGVSGNAAAK